MVGIGLAGALTVALFVLSDASLNIRQNNREQRFALEGLLRQPQEPPGPVSAPAIATSTPLVPELPTPVLDASPAMGGTLTTGVARLESMPVGMLVASATSPQSSIVSARKEKTAVSHRGAARAPIVIPSDAQGEYFVLDHEARGSTRTLVIQRIGPSGVTYSRLRFDCKTHRFKYLSGGNTLAALDRPAPSRPMGLLFEGSISDYWWHHACRAPRPPR